jgi:hypothetical protein
MSYTPGTKQRPIVNVSTSQTLTTWGVTVRVTTGAVNVTIELPPALPANQGLDIQIIKIDSGSGQVIIDGNGADQIGGTAMISLVGINDSASLMSNGVGSEIIEAPAVAAAGGSGGSAPDWVAGSLLDPLVTPFVWDSTIKRRFKVLTLITALQNTVRPCKSPPSVGRFDGDDIFEMGTRMQHIRKGDIGPYTEPAVSGNRALSRVDYARFLEILAEIKVPGTALTLGSNRLRFSGAAPAGLAVGQFLDPVGVPVGSAIVSGATLLTLPSAPSTTTGATVSGLSFLFQSCVVASQFAWAERIEVDGAGANPIATATSKVLNEIVTSTVRNNGTGNQVWTSGLAAITGPQIVGRYVEGHVAGTLMTNAFGVGTRITAYQAPVAYGSAEIKAASNRIFAANATVAADFPADTYVTIGTFKTNISTTIPTVPEQTISTAARTQAGVGEVYFPVGFTEPAPTGVIPNQIAAFEVWRRLTGTNIAVGQYSSVGGLTVPTPVNSYMVNGSPYVMFPPVYAYIHEPKLQRYVRDVGNIMPATVFAQSGVAFEQAVNFSYTASLTPGLGVMTDNLNPNSSGGAYTTALGLSSASLVINRLAQPRNGGTNVGSPLRVARATRYLAATPSSPCPAIMLSYAVSSNNFAAQSAINAAFGGNANGSAILNFALSGLSVDTAVSTGFGPYASPVRSGNTFEPVGVNEGAGGRIAVNSRLGFGATWAYSARIINQHEGSPINQANRWYNTVVTVTGGTAGKNLCVGQSVAFSGTPGLGIITGISATDIGVWVRGNIGVFSPLTSGTFTVSDCWSLTTPSYNFRLDGSDFKFDDYIELDQTVTSGTVNNIVLGAAATLSASWTGATGFVSTQIGPYLTTVLGSAGTGLFTVGAAPVFFATANSTISTVNIQYKDGSFTLDAPMTNANLQIALGSYMPCDAPAISSTAQGASDTFTMGGLASVSAVALANFDGVMGFHQFGAPASPTTFAMPLAQAGANHVYTGSIP